MTAPLAGRRVVVTRAGEQADSLAEQLRALGAEPIIVPLIEIVDAPDDGAALRAALAELAAYDWVVVTSVNGAARVASALADAPPQLRVAAVGMATAAALGRAPDLLPTRQSGAGLVDAFPAGTGRVLLAAAEQASPTVEEGLRAKGWTVDSVVAYATRSVRPSSADLIHVLAADAVLFASGSAVRAWVEAFGRHRPLIAVAIGPSAAAVAADLNLKIDAIATDHSLDGMVSCLLSTIVDSE